MYCLARLFLALLAVTTVAVSEVDVDQEDICSGLPGGTGLTPHPLYCAFYYLCSQGVPALRECPSGLYFNPPVSACDYPSNVASCDGGTHPPEGTTTTRPTTTGIPTSSTTETPEPEPTVPPVTSTSTGSTQTTTTPPGGLYCPPDVAFVFMPYPKDCTQFYVCESGVVTKIQSCSAGLWFNAERQACMTPWTSPCPN